jgi:hypothetical protein
MGCNGDIYMMGIFHEDIMGIFLGHIMWNHIFLEDGTWQNDAKCRSGCQDVPLRGCDCRVHPCI